MRSIKTTLSFFVFFNDFIYSFLERGEGREKEEEKNTDVREKHLLIASRTSPARDLGRHAGTCPDQELNRQSFSLWDNAQPTEPQQSGQEPQFWHNGDTLALGMTLHYCYLPQESVATEVRLVYFSQRESLVKTRVSFQYQVLRFHML